MKTITIKSIYPSFSKWIADECQNVYEWNKGQSTFNRMSDCRCILIMGNHWSIRTISNEITVTSDLLNFVSLRKGIRFNMNKGSVTIS